MLKQIIEKAAQNIHLARITIVSCCRAVHTSSSALCERNEKNCYKKPQPTRYGYAQKLRLEGTLPRIDEEIRNLPRYKASTNTILRRHTWSKQKGVFGQNDYIDILGDGSVEPYQIPNRWPVAPRWLIGFRGNEYARTLRQLKLYGHVMKKIQPVKHDHLNKRLRYLYKKLNLGRHSHQRFNRNI